MLKRKVQKAILKTLCYSDVFEYPLTEADIYHFLIQADGVRKEDIYKELYVLRKMCMIKKRYGYYYLLGREKNVIKRLKRHKISQEKLLHAKKIASILFYIPFVQLVGVSGSLSMMNCKDRDDIDLFIITSKNTLWIVRLLVQCALFLMHEKRSSEDFIAKDKICANMYMSLDHLSIQLSRQNLFTAHEIVQLVVLKQKKDIYHKFLQRNRWVKKHLPYTIPYMYCASEKIYFERVFETCIASIFWPFNELCFLFQYIYMKKRITHEVVRRDIAQFHPLDKTSYVLGLYSLRYSYVYQAWVHAQDSQATAYSL